MNYAPATDRPIEAAGRLTAPTYNPKHKWSISNSHRANANPQRPAGAGVLPQEA